jgi:hypothetical protein
LENTGDFKNIFSGKMGQLPLNYITASQEKPVEWLTYSPVTLVVTTPLAVMGREIESRQGYH